MTAVVLVTGTIWRKPELRKTKTGKTFCTAKIRETNDDGDHVYWAINAFGDDAITELMSAGDGDLVSCRGKLMADVYTPPGRDPRVNLTVSANKIVTLASFSGAAKAAGHALFKTPKQAALPLGPVGREPPF